SRPRHLPHLHSFPTRRSSDLAINAKDYKNGIEKYKSLLAHENFSNLPQIYLDLSRLSIMEADTVSALKFVEEGAAKFPENEELRSEEHTSELQSRENLVCRLL